MLVAVDVQYADTRDLAGVGALVMEHWAASHAVYETMDIATGLKDYVPGQFYQRELPCILPTIMMLLQEFDIEAIIVDSYVDLLPGRAGMGRHLFHALDEQVAIVGVAKSRFTGTHASAVLRGTSRQPLWVTSTCNQNIAAEHVRQMHGDHRLPMLLKRTDRLARNALCKFSQCQS